MLGGFESEVRSSMSAQQILQNKECEITALRRRLSEIEEDNVALQRKTSSSSCASTTSVGESSAGTRIHDGDESPTADLMHSSTSSSPRSGVSRTPSPEYSYRGGNRCLPSLELLLPSETAEQCMASYLHIPVWNQLPIVHLPQFAFNGGEIITACETEVAPAVVTNSTTHVVNKTSSTHELPPNPSELLRMLDASDSSREAAIVSIQDHVVSLSLDAAGCRVVQRALEVSDMEAQRNLIENVHGNVSSLVRSPHGNYVLQKAIRLLPFSCSSFVARELAGMVGIVAREKYGCRVIMRLIEHCIMDTATMDLVDELLADATLMCRHEFAHHTMETLLHYGRPEHRHAIAKALCQDLWVNATDRNATYVIKTAFTHCEWADRHALMGGLMKKGEYGFRLLRSSESGVHVLKSLRWFVGQNAHEFAWDGQNVQALFRAAY